MTSKLKLSLAFSRNSRVTPLLDGDVHIEGVEIIPSVVNPGDLFWRQFHAGEFDISELSLSGLIMQKARRIARYSMVPVFPSRSFFHTAAVTRRAVGIESPSDLRGRRVGVREFQQTAALWARGAFLHEWGVDPTEIEWWIGRPPSLSQGSATGFSLPPNMKVSYVASGDSLGAMLLDGRLDAQIAYSLRAGGLGFGTEDDRHSADLPEGLVDRVEPNLSGDARVTPLFGDPTAEGRRYFETTGLLPMNHVAVIRDDLVDRHPWLARNVFDGFCRASALAARRARRHVEGYAGVGMADLELFDRAEHLFSYGVDAARSTLEAAVSYSHEQGLISEPIDLQELFFPATWET